MIDFKRIDNDALSQAESLLRSILPAGKIKNHEFTIGSFAGEPGGSLSFNLNTGVWCEFSSDKSGAGVISFFAEFYGVKQAEAAKLVDEAMHGGVGVTTTPKPIHSPALTPVAIPAAITVLPWGPDIDPPHLVTMYDEKTKEWKNYAVSESYQYHNEQGRLVGYTLRIDYEDGSKDILPYSYTRDSHGRESWRRKSFLTPRPMYNLLRLRDCPVEEPVLILEGEGKTDVAQEVLHNYVVLSWPGGCKAVNLFDIEPLRGREVILWPDADLQTNPKTKELYKPNEQPGMKAMIKIKERLAGIAASVFIVTPPPGKKDGWDLKDAIRDEGWDGKMIMDYIDQQKHLQETEAKHSVNVTQSIPKTQTQQTQQKTTAVPFRMLGYDSGSFFYMPDESLQILSLTASQHTKSELLQLAPMKFWQDTFGGDDGSVAWTAVSDYLLRSQFSVGIFDPSMIRGRGAWIDNGDVVYHEGDRIFTSNDKETARYKIQDFDTKFIYTKSYSIGIDSQEPLGNKEAASLIQLTESLSWKHSLSGKLLAGWCFIAPICGMLTWRPHIWINGPSGTGKSWTIENIVRPCCSKAAIQVLSSSTEAGIRQKLKHDAVEIIFDEAESNDKRGQDRMQTIIEFARGCSSDTNAVIAKGTASGAGMGFKPRGSFCFGSIGVSAVYAADTSRITSLELKKRDKGFDETKRILSETIMKDGYCQNLRYRALMMGKTIKHNAVIFSKAVALRLSDARLGDQIGSLLAGAYSLTSMEEVDLVFATEWVAMQDWSLFERTETDTDQHNALGLLMSTVLRDGNNQSDSIGDLLHGCKVNECYTASSTTVALLKRHGVKPIENGVYISNNHPFLVGVYQNTPWAGKYKDQMSRINGAKPSSTRFNAMTLQRAYLIPWEAFD